MRFEQQLRSFLKALDQYPGNMPLAKFLPGYFKQNKQMGSNDRRTVSRLLYSYFRLGRACDSLPPEQRLFIAEFLCSTEENLFLKHFRPDLHEHVLEPVNNKILLLKNEGFVLESVFPFTGHLSDGIDKEAFLKSFFVQPDLFICIHPGKEEFVKEKLVDHGINYRTIAGETLALPNGTKLHEIFPASESMPFEIQDLSSQRTGSLFEPKENEYWWDACAASGGKSILLFQLQPDVKLLVSDIRESVLANLDVRFQNAGIRTYQKKVLNLLENPAPVLHHYQFDGIILDAPCTGSGTWGRTPEMVSQFQEHKIMEFQAMQKTIASNVIGFLKPGKPLIYITCSVFKEENEDVVSYLVNEKGLTLEKLEVLKGFNEKADTMFAARFIR
ncbi:MAG TPA: RsmB/NOP family class I SAM-dependent RNA methyltransferase [Sphingobacteriaceae bacterium]